MLVIPISFITSLVVVWLICLTQRWHAKLTMDHDLNGIQKMHTLPVPRVGGIAVFSGIIIAAVYDSLTTATAVHSFYLSMLLPLSLIFAAGISEDLFKSVSPRSRMLIMLAAVLVAVMVCNSLPLIRHMDHPILDDIFKFTLVAFALTAFAVIGVSNAYNIIDGFNGLSATGALINLVGLGLLSVKLGSIDIAVVAFSVAATIVGFLFFNYPKGKIFLGDGGAYSIGFCIAFLSLNVVDRHWGQVSPYAVLLLAAYPITETVFTIIRRKLIQKTNAMQPDNLHLHQLVFDRCTPHQYSLEVRNALVMPIMLLFMLPQLGFALVCYHDTGLILIGLFAYMAYYLYFYLRFVRFKTPKFLLFKTQTQNLYK